MDIGSLAGFGYFGLFLLALVSNAIPYSTIPYLIFLVPILSRLNAPELLNAIVVLATGATAGKLIVYVIGRSISRVKAVSTLTSGLIAFAKRHKLMLFTIIFAIAALPIPDDIFYIPIGASRYDPVLFSIALFAGKFVITVLVALYGLALKGLVEGYIGLPPQVSIPIMVLVTALLMVGVGGIDWEDVERAYLERGVVAASATVLRHFVKATFKKPLNKLKSLVHNIRSGDEEEPGRSRS